MCKTSESGLVGAAKAGPVVGVTAAGLALWWLARVTGDLTRGLAAPGPASPSEVLTSAAAVAALACALWLALSVGLALLEHLPGRVGSWARRTSDRLAPAVIRRVAATLVGATLGAAAAPGTAAGTGSPAVHDVGAAVTAPAPAVAPTQAVGPGWAPYRSGVSGPGWTPPPSNSVTAPTVPGPPAPGVPGWVPDRPAIRPLPSPRLLTPRPRAVGRPGVVVRRGDTLWAIVARQLGPDASAAEVAQAWPLWHRANRAVIGGDPHLILPGQVLRPPAMPGAGS